MDQAPTDFESDLVDLNDVTLRELMTLDDSVLGHALRRLWHEADLPEELVAGFNQTI
jgi:FXSXX-COOH protein